MNIFAIHKLAAEAAKQHCDKHVVKMILETCQMLYTAWWRGRKTPPWIACEGGYEPYKAMCHNHPCSIWCRAEKENYEYLVKLGLELCKEFKRRYNNQHTGYFHLKRLEKMGYPELLEPEDYLPDLSKRATFNCPENTKYLDIAISDHIFDICAVYDPKSGFLDAVETYKNYYISKTYFDLVWNRGLEEPPDWYMEGIKNDKIRGAIRKRNLEMYGIKEVSFKHLKMEEKPEGYKYSVVWNFFESCKLWTD